MNYLQLIAGKFTALDSRDRVRIGMAVALVLVLAILFSTANDGIRRLEKKRAAREADVAEMLLLKARFLEASAASQKMANRLAATKSDDSPAKIIEEIGIKGRNSQIKPVKGDETAGMVEDAAEVRVEGVTANEAINLVYRLEKGPRPVVVKRALLKTRFDDPSRMDLNLTVALLKAAPQGQR